MLLFALYFELNAHHQLIRIFFNFLLTSTLLPQYMRNFGRPCIQRTLDSYRYSVYFLKGNDSRLLNLSQQLEISSFISSDNLSSSCLVYNPTEASRKLSAWKNTLPWIKPHYAIKSNPTMELIKDLANQGAGMDCASKEEIKSSLKAGVSLDNIVYSNPIKNEKDLSWASETGVKLTTADSIDQLIKIKNYAPNMDILWRIAIKEEASDNLATPFSGKFGDDLENDEMICERMNQISEMGIKLKGIHFHCGSGQHGSSAFGKAVKLSRKCLEIGRMYGHQMSILDIGGGFPAGQLSNKTVQALKPTQKDELKFKVIAEPGRHFSSRCFYLLTRILGKRMKAGKPCYHINQSLYHSFNCTLMDGVSFENSSDQFYSKIDESKQPSAIFETKNSTLFGMTCDGMDIITKSISIPIEAKVGDWLCFNGMGAYTHGCRSNFNGMTSTERIIRWPTVVHEEAEERQAHPLFV